MPEPLYLLTENDLVLLRGLLDKEAKRQVNRPIPSVVEKPGSAQARYVVVLPCGENLPGRVGNVPGIRDGCCIFKMELDDPYDTNSPYTLTQVVDAVGEPFRVKVFNVRTGEIPADYPPGEFYIPVSKDAYGRYIAETGDTGGGEATTTTTQAPVPSPCTGMCKWLWTEDEIWELDTDSCEDAPTTTTTTTTTTTGTGTTTSTTTTSSPCLCPPTTTTTVDPGSTTTTETTTTSEPTTTTTAVPTPCKCLYPDHCGTAVGDCVYTFCAKEESQIVVECTSTTTSTTCDCNTTTTTPQPPNCNGCNWTGFEGGWLLSSMNCDGECTPCDPPQTNPVECSGAHTPCKPPIAVQTTPPPQCIGECIYLWSTIDEVWVQIDSTCQFTGGPCYCISPSEPGNECSIITMPCGSPITTTTQPPGNCAHCYTTTTTSTTPEPCDRECRWRWPGTTSTTTTTETTTTPVPACCLCNESTQIPCAYRVTVLGRTYVIPWELQDGCATPSENCSWELFGLADVLDCAVASGLELVVVKTGSTASWALRLQTAGPLAPNYYNWTLTEPLDGGGNITCGAKTLAFWFSDCSNPVTNAVTITPIYDCSEAATTTTTTRSPWDLELDPCPPACPCYPPAIDGHEECEITWTPCGQPTTTTLIPTTTTSSSTTTTTTITPPTTTTATTTSSTTTTAPPTTTTTTTTSTTTTT